MSVKTEDIDTVNNTWIETDDYQSVKKIKENKYTIVDLIIADETIYFVTSTTVDISDYTQSEIEEYILMYYPSKEHFHEVTPKDDRKQLIAEMIAEQEVEIDRTFYTKDKAVNYLNSITINK